MKNNDIILQIKNVTMNYRLPSEKIGTLKEFVVRFLKGQIKYKTFDVLKDINIEVKKGESLGLIGLNGAGKSTLLKIIAGIIPPTKGEVKVNGTLVPLLKLGAGFDHEMTGRENIYLNGAIMGFSKKEMSKKIDSIIEFSELGSFIDVPIKNYSSGMVTRLGFSIAVDVQPDIMLIDEVLGVGDTPFREKCAKKIDELQKTGTTFIVVSHSPSDIKSLCKKAIYLKNGEIIEYGNVNNILTLYEKEMWLNERRT